MLQDIKFIVIDVDGTLTDGGIYYDNQGNELKKFNTKDAAGFFVAKRLGVKTIVLTGRCSLSTEKRVKELGCDFVFQNVKDKFTFLNDFMINNQISKNNLAYIGDDLNDLQSMKLAGFVACPLDSCKEVKDVADYISSCKGGNGAVRDVFEYLFRKINRWTDSVSSIYNCGI